MPLDTVVFTPCTQSFLWLSVCSSCVREELPLQSGNKNGHAEVFFSPDGCILTQIQWGETGLTKMSLKRLFSSLVSVYTSNSPAGSVRPIHLFESAQLENRGRHCCDSIYPLSAGVRLQLQRRPTLPLMAGDLRLETFRPHQAEGIKLCLSSPA